MPGFPFDAVLFDCDGVLVDSERITCRVLTEMLNDLGWSLTLEEAMQIFIGKAIKDEAPLIESRTGAPVTAQWLGTFRQRRDAVLERELLAIPGATDAVLALHASLEGRIAVASGADRQKIELQLDKVGIHHCFEGRVFSGHEMPRSKPYPDVYLAAARALGVDPVRCAVVEDTVTGATAGVAAGAHVFAYCPGGPDTRDATALREVGVVDVFQHMHQLPTLLASWTR